MDQEENNEVTQSPESIGESTVPTTISIKAGRKLSYEQAQKVMETYRFLSTSVHITPYDQTISFSGIQLRETEFPSLKHYRKIILASYPNNPFIKLLDLCRKDNKLNKKIAKVVKDEGKSVFEAILDLVGNTDKIKNFDFYLSEILKGTSIYQFDLDYQFHALVIYSEIINTLISFGIEPQLLLFNISAQSMINTRVLMNLANQFCANGRADAIFQTESIELTPIKFLLQGQEEKVIEIFESNPEILNNNKIAKLDTAVRYGRDKIVEYILASIDFNDVSNDMYVELYNSALQAIIRGHPQTCLHFVSPRVWNLFNEGEQAILLSTIATRSGEITREILVDNLIKNGLFTYCLFAQMIDRYSHSSEKLTEISAVFTKYQPFMICTMLKTVFDNATKKEEYPVHTVLKISGVIALTKFFTKAAKKQAIAEMYNDLEPFIVLLQEQFRLLDRNKNKHNFQFLDLILDIAKENSKKSVPSAVEEVTSIPEVVSSKKAKIPPQKKSPKKKAFKIEQDDYKDEPVVVSSLGDKPDNDPDSGKAKVEVQEGDLSPKIGLDEPVAHAEVTPAIENSSVIKSSSLIVVPQPPKKSWAAIVSANIPVKEKPQKEKVDFVQPDADSENMVEVNLPKTLPPAIETIEVIHKEDKQATAASSSEISSLGPTEVSEVVKLGVYTPPGDNEIPEIIFGSFGDDEITNSVDENNEDKEQYDKLKSQVESNGQPVISSASAVPTMLTLESYPSASSKAIPVARIINALHQYQEYTLKTQWYVTSSLKLIYSLIITKPDGLDNYYFDLRTGGVAQLTKEEYESLKPANISTSDHQITGDCYIFNVVEFIRPGIPIFQYVINFPLNFIQITNIFNIPVPVVEEILQSQAISDGSATGINENGAAATTSASDNSSALQKQEDSTGDNSSATHNSSTNLSNQVTQNNSSILENFKKNEPESIELTISTALSFEDVYILDNENEYQENKEEAEKRFEDQYSVKIQVEDYSNKVNITYYNPEFEISGLLKPLLGEYDQEGIKMPSFAGYSA